MTKNLVQQLYKLHLHAWIIMYLCWKVIAELEVLEEGGHDDGGEEENDTPEEDVRNIGPLGAAGAAHKLPAVLNTVLKQQVEVRRRSH